MFVRCPRENCHYEWEYKGKADFYTSCPKCHSSVRLKPIEKKEEVG